MAPGEGWVVTLERHSKGDILVSVKGRRRKCRFDCALKAVCPAWCGKVFIYVVINKFVHGGVQMSYQKSLMIVWCLNPYAFT